MLILNETKVILSAVQRSDIPALRQQLATGGEPAAMSQNAVWSIALIDLAKVETGAGEAQGEYMKFCSKSHSQASERTIPFHSRAEGTSFFNHLRDRLGDGWEEQLARDWGLFGRDMLAGVVLCAFLSALFMIMFLAASGLGENPAEDEGRRGVLKTIVVGLSAWIGLWLGTVGTVMLWIAVVGFTLYKTVYPGWRGSLRLLCLSPRRP